jgi:hypothetical protein
MRAGCAFIYSNYTEKEVAMKTLLVIVAALAIPMSAQAATKHHRTAPRQTYQPQIACTDVGCLPVPRGCFPTGGKRFDGSPSGFDVMVCPDGTRYGHL